MDFMELWVGVSPLSHWDNVHVIFFGLDLHFLGIDLLPPIHRDSQPFPPSSRPSAKRGNIIVSLNFAIQKGIQISCSTVKWFGYNDLGSVE